MKEAMLYEPIKGGKVYCRLCSHHCVIDEGDYGFCGVRENVGGILYTHSYGEIVAANVDPVEKKPLYHFYPGSLAFSIATMGCNFRCDFCQNWRISQTSPRDGAKGRGIVEPEEIVSRALEKHCRVIAYTYTEPTIFFEYAYDTARAAGEKGLANAFVTNGFMTAEALETARPYLDACNVDLKSFRNAFYKERCQARLQPVLDTIRKVRELGIWLEVTTLIVPGQNDSEEELADIAAFIAEVDPDIPWHISRFHPDYRLTDARPTPVSTLEKARSLGKGAGLNYIYMGNVPGASVDTFCPACGALVIKRGGFGRTEVRLQEGRCAECGRQIAGVFS
ncbi:MAG: AmmeMemoRadiSam system radical SAM enzyme [Desulfobacteraceae bacterium]